jgi:hypothetical protein
VQVVPVIVVWAGVVPAGVFPFVVVPVVVPVQGVEVAAPGLADWAKAKDVMASAAAPPMKSPLIMIVLRDPPGSLTANQPASGPLGCGLNT